MVAMVMQRAAWMLVQEVSQMVAVARGSKVQSDEAVFSEAFSFIFIVSHALPCCFLVLAPF